MSSLYSINSLEIFSNLKSCIEKPWSGNVFIINFNLLEVISRIFRFIKYNLYLSYNSRAFIELWKIKMKLKSWNDWKLNDASRKKLSHSSSVFINSVSRDPKRETGIRENAKWREPKKKRKRNVRENVTKEIISLIIPNYINFHP